MGYYPVFIQLKGRRCVVIGGGNIAEGKVNGLLNAEGDVTVVAPSLTANLRQLRDEGRVKTIEREYQDGDLKGYELCMVATDDGAVNTTVAAEGKRLGVWVNASDDTPNCDFILPSVVRQGSIVLAASTGGGSPALARRLREELTDFLAEDYAPLAELLAAIRTDLRRRNLSPDSEVWAKAIDARFRALVAQRRPDEARTYLLERLGVSSALSAEG
uniref:precorrin-2 dehydrogenase n=1 Tax=uncultured bacterium 5G4 TaxID=1701326 RepID=A0A166H3P4_9BACT|nr:siroheme synthase [uncultured bacterium 5G4]